MEPVLALAALGVGALLAVQVAANAQLAAAVRSPLTAATASFAVGSVLLVAAAAAAGAATALHELGEVEPAHLAGGLLGALYVASAIVLFPRLGAALSVGLFIGGQVTAGFVLDATGAVGVPREQVGALQVAGLGVVLAGVAGLVAGSRAAGSPGRGVPGLLALGLLAGAALPVQGALNAQLRSDLAAPVAAAAVSFVVGAAALAVVAAWSIARRRAPRPRLRELSGLPWWAYAGGLLGAAYVLTVLVLIPELGAAATVGLTVAGQQVASLLVDRFGWLRLARRPATAARIAGVLALLAGVLLIHGA
jgi:transporter family-2 protein